MIGVLVNVLTVLVGAFLGLLFRRGISEKVSRAAMIGLGACTFVIGIDGSLGGENPLILIASVVLGGLVGTLLDLDGAIKRLAARVEGNFQKGEKKNSLAEGLVSATLLFCVGSMTVTGSLQAGLTGDNSVLFTKAALDLVSSMMLAATLGAGVLLAAGSVLVIQGALVLAAGLVAPLLGGDAVAEMLSAGNVLVILLGLNLMEITKIKVADYLPAIFFAPLFYHFSLLF